MTAKKKDVTKDIPLTALQVERLNLYAAQAQVTQQRLNEYLTAVTDAEGLEGSWTSLGIEGDPSVLRLKKNEG